ncbi:PadR family transcriptional regulator [Roseibium aestuarii]|uniref:PadR family transcriptional regulator n=1 Tax=Roseibium aestuarii TaxID=2600299 RepID=A0ABW4JZD5_9HYPH|nr:PadR family transcriptional regulator [Roseibium aestuarii]
MFDYGELRHLLLLLIRDKPSHGYELIKDIEERFGGSYSPSPGVIYPTLTWLNDMGYADVTETTGGRKSYTITEAGQSFLEANGPVGEALLGRLGGGADGDSRNGPPLPILRAMENLKFALRLRLKDGEASRETIAAMAAVLDEATRKLETLE